MLTKHFLKITTGNIGTSFLFGTASNLLSRSIEGGLKEYKLRMPDSYDIKSSLRSGGELAKHALVYSLNLIILNKIGLPFLLLHLSSTFFTAFLLSFRNGTNYASKTAFVSSITAFVKSCIMRK